MSAVLDWGSDFNPTKMQVGGTVGVGKAIFQITKITEKDGKFGGFLIVKFAVVAHQDPVEVGKVYSQIHSLTGEGAQGTVKLLLATKVLTIQDFADAKAQGTEIVIPFEKMVTEFVAGEITENKEKKQKVWEWYGLDSPEVADYPTIPVDEDPGAHAEEQVEPVTDDDIVF